MKHKSSAQQKNHNTFKNTPLLDFSLAQHREHFQKALSEWRFPLKIPLVIDNQEVPTEKSFQRENPSCPSQIVAEVSQAEQTHCDRALKSALKCFTSWRCQPVASRAGILSTLADKMEDKRYQLSALQVLEVGKSWEAADADVAEAIDFCRYYAEEMRQNFSTPRLTDKILGEESFYSWQGRGVAVVIAPWNFPLAILTGMTTACLVTGNTVLIKPAEQSSATAFELIKLLMECGVPAGVVHFLPGIGEQTGAYLTDRPEVEIIAFTGSKEVGCSILEKVYRVSDKNRLKKCVVEMGGKNAIIVDANADLDMAIKGVVESAFGFQGQKCSACSRVLVDEKIKKAFTSRLVEAVQSLSIGPAKNPDMRIGPVVSADALKKIQKYVALGEKTARIISSKPAQLPKEGYFINPVIFDQVEPNSPLLKEEIFGPVLALQTFKTLDEALNIALDTDFALTGAFYSRSPSRIEQVKKEFDVGNLYINRNCTGALVKRHPFGGFKMSGLGTKAGGPDYLTQFMNPRVVTENTVRRGFTPHLFSSPPSP